MLNWRFYKKGSGQSPLDRKAYLTGQAAVELAIFGSLILLALGVFVKYGLSANYSQKLKMDTFRSSLKESTEANIDRDQAHSVTYVLVKDKPIPDPSDPFGISSHDSSFGASDGIAWSTNLFDIPDYPADNALFSSSQLPRIIYNINGTPYTFTTAAFKHYGYNSQALKRKDYEHGRWYWRTSGVSRTEGNVEYRHDDDMEIDGDFWADIPDRSKNLRDEELAGKESAGVDVDGDGEEEQVLQIDVKKVGSHTEYVVEEVWIEDVDHPDGGYYEWVRSPIEVDDYGVDGLYVLDSQEGQIDLGDEGPRGPRQGLQLSSRNDLIVDSSILRQEDSSKIKSNTNSKWNQDVTRYIIVNPNYVEAAKLIAGDNILAGLALGYGDIDGDDQADWYVEIKSSFSEDKTLEWEVSHAN